MPANPYLDRKALDEIATLLGSRTEWSSPADLLDTIVEAIKDTGRPDPGAPFRYAPGTFPAPDGNDESAVRAKAYEAALQQFHRPQQTSTGKAAA